jgi:hypothetical protein
MVSDETFFLRAATGVSAVAAARARADIARLDLETWDTLRAEQ